MASSACITCTAPGTKNHHRAAYAKRCLVAGCERPPACVIVMQTVDGELEVTTLCGPHGDVLEGHIVEPPLKHPESCPAAAANRGP